jgi:hypothetical protein
MEQIKVEKRIMFIELYFTVTISVMHTIMTSELCSNYASFNML